MNECGLLSSINTSVYQHLLTTYCVHITTGRMFKTLLTLKNNYLKIAYKPEPCNTVYLSYFCFYRSIKIRLKVYYSATVVKRLVLILPMCKP